MESKTIYKLGADSETENNLIVTKGGRGIYYIYIIDTYNTYIYI